MKTEQDIINEAVQQRLVTDARLRGIHRKEKEIEALKRELNEMKIEMRQSWYDDYQELGALKEKVNEAYDALIKQNEDTH